MKQRRKPVAKVVKFRKPKTHMRSWGPFMYARQGHISVLTIWGRALYWHVGSKYRLLTFEKFPSKAPMPVALQCLIAVFLIGVCFPASMLFYWIYNSLWGWAAE